MSDNLYQRQLRNIDIEKGWIDYYVIADLYELDSVVEHALKKLLIAGGRSGGKSKKRDLTEARNQLNRAIDDIELAERLEREDHDPSDMPEGATHYCKKEGRWYKEYFENTVRDWFYWKKNEWAYTSFNPDWVGTLTKIEDLKAEEVKEKFIPDDLITIGENEIRPKPKSDISEEINILKDWLNSNDNSSKKLLEVREACIRYSHRVDSATVYAAAYDAYAAASYAHIGDFPAYEGASDSAADAVDAARDRVKELVEQIEKGEFSHKETETLKEEEIKEGFININGHMVPEPEREELLKGEAYYMPSFDIYEDFLFSSNWSSDECDFTMLERGLIHTTKEAAETHAKALLSFTKQDNKS